MRAARYPNLPIPIALALLACLAFAAPAAASDVYVANAISNNVSQYDVGADGSLSPKRRATLCASAYRAGVAVSSGPTAEAGPDQAVESEETGVTLTGPDPPIPTAIRSPTAGPRSLDPR